MLELAAPAKINLFLLVGGRRRDGYHEVFTLMERVSLADRLRFGRSGGGIEVRGMEIPPRENLVYRALAALGELAGFDPALEVEIEKQVPAAAGLGGGSSDAATALRAAGELCGRRIREEILVQAAAATGADVPFFLGEGLGLASGAGERLEPAPPLPAYHAVIAVLPDAGLSTAAVYAEYDRLLPGPPPLEKRVAEKQRQLEGVTSLESLVPLLENDLEPAALSLVPEIGELKEELSGQGADATLMSGSGPAVFGLFRERRRAGAAAAAMARRYRAWLVHPLRG